MRPTPSACKPAALFLAAALVFSGLASAQAPAKDAPAKPAASGQAQKPADDQAQITVKGAKDDAAAKAKLRADSLLARCVIKPVMTDDEIQLCITAYRQTDRK